MCICVLKWNKLRYRALYFIPTYLQLWENFHVIAQTRAGHWACFKLPPNFYILDSHQLLWWWKGFAVLVETTRCYRDCQERLGWCLVCSSSECWKSSALKHAIKLAAKPQKVITMMSFGDRGDGIFAEFRLIFVKQKPHPTCFLKEHNLCW